jgi:hypothetical protein
VDEPRFLVESCGLNCRDLVPTQALAHDVETAGHRKVRCSSRNGEPIAPVNDFSGLVNSICALASAAAIVPIDSLERCIVGLRLIELKADRP